MKHKQLKWGRAAADAAASAAVESRATQSGQAGGRAFGRGSHVMFPKYSTSIGDYIRHLFSHRDRMTMPVFHYEKDQPSSQPRAIHSPTTTTQQHQTKPKLKALLVCGE